MVLADKLRKVILDTDTKWQMHLEEITAEGLQERIDYREHSRLLNDRTTSHKSSLEVIPARFKFGRISRC